MDITGKVTLSRITPEGRGQAEDPIAREVSLSIFLNDRKIITLPCSPLDLDRLAAGYLLAEGYIEKSSDIREIITDEETGGVKVKTSCESRRSTDDSLKKVESDFTMSAGEVFALMEKFIRTSDVFKATGGVHSAALCDRKNIIVYKEDIGRNNAIDKVFGECLLNGISLDERVMAVSCRISSEILLKTARRGIPVIMTKSPPTDLGVKMADEYGIALLGFVRGKKMNAYTHDWRITDNDRK
jgi:FdhD protein